MLMTTFNFTKLCDRSIEASYAHAWAETTWCICMCIVGTVYVCGYNGQQNYTICDACRPYKHTEASFFLPNLIDSLYLQLAQVPRGWDLVIFVTMTMTMTERRQTEPITFLLVHACEWGKNWQFVSHKTYFKLYYYPHEYKFVCIELPGHGQTTGITA